MNWKEATNTQLLTIIHHEDCPYIYKLAAQEEYLRRQKERYARNKRNYLKIAGR